jgi:hypothetical protein
MLLPHLVVEGLAAWVNFRQQQKNRIEKEKDYLLMSAKAADFMDVLHGVLSDPELCGKALRSDSGAPLIVRETSPDHVGVTVDQITTGRTSWASAGTVVTALDRNLFVTRMYFNGSKSSPRSAKLDRPVEDDVYRGALIVSFVTRENTVLSQSLPGWVEVNRRTRRLSACQIGPPSPKKSSAEVVSACDITPCPPNPGNCREILGISDILESGLPRCACELRCLIGLARMRQALSIIEDQAASK